MIQGHDKEQCYVKHQELFKNKNKKEKETKEEPGSDPKAEEKNPEAEADKDKEEFVAPKKKQGHLKSQ